MTIIDGRMDGYQKLYLGQFLDFVDEFLGAFGVGGFGGDSYNRLGVAGPEVHPAVGKADVDAVACVDFGLRIVGVVLFDGGQGGLNFFGKAGEFCLQQVIAGNFIDELADGFAGFS